jgi:hypothetical protein
MTHGRKCSFTSCRAAACLLHRRSHELDAAAALLLAHLLRPAVQAGEVRVLSADQVVSDPSNPTLGKAKLICLSLISTSTPARVRYLVRRVRRRAPDANLILGFGGYRKRIWRPRGRQLTA